MTLRDQILARIDATPYRPPTFADLARHCRADLPVQWAIVEMFAAREIDTENGTDGLTYRRKVQPSATSPHAPILPARKDQSFGFPAKFAQPSPIVKNTPAERAAINAAKVPPRMPKRERAPIEKAHLIATRAKAAKVAKVAKIEEKRNAARTIAQTVDAHLTGAMSAAQFAKAAGVSKTIASAMLYRSVVRGRIFADAKARPKLYFFAAPAAEQVTQFRAAAQDLKRRQYGLEPDKIAAEYKTGAKIKDQAARWSTSIKTIRAILRSEKVTLRTPQECAAALRGVERDMTPEHKQKCRDALAKARAEGRLKHQALKDENEALRARLAQLEAEKKPPRHKRMDAFEGRENG